MHQVSLTLLISTPNPEPNSIDMSAAALLPSSGHVLQDVDLEAQQSLNKPIPEDQEYGRRVLHRDALARVAPLPQQFGSGWTFDHKDARLIPIRMHNDMTKPASQLYSHVPVVMKLVFWTYEGRTGSRVGRWMTSAVPISLLVRLAPAHRP
jgi:hypothetical protein